MFKNYFKTALRNLLRHKLFSGLNIFGLATGMACSILIFLWVQDELSFDKFNQGTDRIFRLTAKISDVEAAVVPPSLAYKRYKPYGKRCFKKHSSQLTPAIRYSFTDRFI